MSLLLRDGGHPNPNVRATALHCLDGNGEPVSFVAVYESHCIVGLDSWYAIDGVWSMCSICNWGCGKLKWKWEVGSCMIWKWETGSVVVLELEVGVE
jgi:hypothetical protein